MKLRTKWAVTLLLLSLPVTLSQAEGGKDQKRVAKANAPLGSPNRTNFNINRISTVSWNDGETDLAANGTAALVYPKGSGRSSVYASGMNWTARRGPGGEVVAGGYYYFTGLRCGKILADGTAEDPGLSKNRIYRVRRDIPPGNTTANILSELQGNEGSAEGIYGQYHKDWNEWPWQDGAPYDDINGNGRYDPGTDVPGVPGADQTIWYVANDLNSDQSTTWGCNPLGVELQTTIWGYAREDALGNMYFRKALLINRGTTSFDSMYVGLWADPDLGDPWDDVVGCDTTRSLAFIYNATDNDMTYAPLPPPAVGFDFFQGPVVPGQPGDSAVFQGKRVYGMRNLPMTAFYFFNWALSDEFSDPPYQSYAATLGFYNLMRGLTKNGNTWIDPNGNSTGFPFTGDPVTQTGWLYEKTYPPGDQRVGLASGPFTLAVGDTQEIVLATICAGAETGIDRLSAVSLLRYYDDMAQLAYNNFFNLPAAPPAPVVAASALDGEVVLSWGDSAEAVSATENSNIIGYRFQGYNVYQLPSVSSAVSEGKRLATFDIVDGVGRIRDRAFDAASGEVVTVVKQFGTDSGIRREMMLNTDAFRNGLPLVNGTTYYFAVTAYNYNADPLAVPRTMENPIAAITLTPHSPNPGTRYGGTYGDTVKNVSQTVPPGFAQSDGSVVPLIVDPAKLTGHHYTVTFHLDSTGQTLWDVLDATSGVTKAKNQTNLKGDGAYPIVDGVLVKVIAAGANGMKSWKTGGNGKLHFTYVDAQGFGLDEFNGTIGSAYYSWFSGSTVDPGSLKNVVLKFAGADGTWDPRSAQTDPDFSKAYRYMRRASAAPAKPEFAPWIINKSGTYPFQEFSWGVPFAAYDTEVQPPRRLAVGHFENNMSGGLVDGRYWPGVGGTGVDNYATAGPREWFFVFDVAYSETSDPGLAKDIYTNTLPIMWWGTVNRAPAAPDFESASEFYIPPTLSEAPVATFSFTVPANTEGDAALARGDVNAVNVFPNPYYGVNPQELDKYNRFVTFSHLPARATIRIFNLAGVMVRRIDRTSTSQFEKWDLRNEAGLPVGSGMYIAHIDMPDLGVTKTLKFAIVQEQQILDRY